MLQFLPANLQSTMIEIIPYFTDSFKNSSQIDYGTDHETNFAAWLYCLAQLGVIKEEDYHAMVARVFVKYLELMRKLQLVYCLEPAGSHGVWGLDDYHFLSFFFSSSQEKGNDDVPLKCLFILKELSSFGVYFTTGVQRSYLFHMLLWPFQLLISEFGSSVIYL
ncbi:serine/threonine-protein phosphatase 2A activator 2-like [Castanea sativa]|uniref:serine/threonine-protein phosphatase 2A activator 2-like n=1 Tax=Castanea sativa TaxID=21020 RepID=UPI003F653684